MPIHQERAAQQLVHARDMRAVLEAWRSSLLLSGRVEQRWKSRLAFHGHLLLACIRFWRMPWDGDTRAAFDAWRSSLWLRRRIEQRCKSWLVSNGRLLAACMRTWRMDRYHKPRVPPRGFPGGAMHTASHGLSTHGLSTQMRARPYSLAGAQQERRKCATTLLIDSWLHATEG